ncbi:MAG TPA: AAA family ATPase [Ignavibacteriales bacterium]|nr:AAA family ATPase [Ignavibacteriales bacterium]
MKKIQLVSLEFKNFKGLKDEVIPLNEDITFIYGQNGTGKTTIVDGFRWLLFDKDSTDRKDFEIKTLDKWSRVIHGLEHTVIGKIKVNGRMKVFQKTLREKWEKKRGESESRLTGNETLYYVNEIPVKMAEYKSEVNDLLEEQIFKLITDPLYFSTGIQWQARRNVLMAIIGDIDTDRIIGYETELAPLRSLLVNIDAEDSLKVETLKKSLQARKKRLNDDIKAIPFRIDEANKSIRELDFAGIKNEVEQKKARLQDVEKQLLSHSEIDGSTSGKMAKLQKVRNEISTIRNREEGRIFDRQRELKRAISNYQSQAKEEVFSIQSLKRAASRLTDEKERLEKNILNFRQAWQTEHERQFLINESFECPTCHRPLNPEVVEERKAQLLEDFNTGKARKLALIQEEGKEAARVKAESESKIASYEEEIKGHELKLKEAEEKEKLAAEELKGITIESIVYMPDYWMLIEEEKTLSEELVEPADIKEKLNRLASEKKTLQQEIDRLKDELSQEAINRRQKERINELMEQERTLAQQIAEIEGQEFLCEKFIRTKVELLESSINEKFQFVRFKLFDTQINGGLTETCEALINGVPFRDANSASRINAGLDIINALQAHYKVQAPIFIDNRESITELIDTPSQVINLIVSSQDKQLRVA